MELLFHRRELEKAKKQVIELGEKSPVEVCGICGNDDIWLYDGPPNKETVATCGTCGATRIGIIKWQKWKRREQNEQEEN